MSGLQAAPKLPKWPFYVADLMLSAIAAYVLTRLGAFEGSASVAIAVACLVAAAWGAWLSITPWLTEFRSHSSLAENSGLKSALDQIQNIEKVGELIRQANAHWQGVQDASGRTVAAAREISERMKVETDEFMKFIENAHDQERAGLRLEVDKFRKMEGDWIKVAVQMLDHTFALFRAAERSGQEGLVQQLGQFQNACRDVARRMGLVPYLPTPGEKYDPRGHQLPNPPAMIEENSSIREVLATGFTYQGQLLRRSLVLLEESTPASTMEAPPESTTDQTEAAQERPIFRDSETRAEYEREEAFAHPEEKRALTEEEPAIGTEQPTSIEAEPPFSEEESRPPKRARAPQEPRDQNELPLL